MSARRVAACGWLLCAVLVAGGAPVVRAGEAAGRPLQQRLEALEVLIERSSAARRIEQSGLVGAAAGRDSARALLAEARNAAGAGDAGRAAALATRASAAMFAAARLAEGADGGAAAAPSAQSVGDLIDSGRSLAAAARRVSTERGAAARSAPALQQIDELLATAQRERDAGRVEAAHSAASRGYLSARVLLVELRQGATLVRSLHFSSPEEEYRYELDRHDAHRMILEMVRSDRQLDTSTQQFVGAALEQARAARLRAEQSAARGAHVAAIAELDAATRQLLAAIRRAGLYVPG